MIRRFLYIYIVVFFSSLCVALAAQAQTKIDPYLEMPGRGMRDAGLGKALLLDGRIPDVEVFIKTSNPTSTRASIEATGGSVRMAVGDIMTASVDTAALTEIARGNEVIFIEAAKPLHTKNDVASSEINAVEVHSGTQLSAAYTGKGVVVGLVDTGLDYKHPDFMDANGKNRILSIWDQNQPGGPPPTEAGLGYGTECSAQSITDGTCPVRDAEGHGTHVAGTMAGRHGTYGGMAPDANIIAVLYDSSMDVESGYANTTFSTKICEAVYYIFIKAAALGMPAVVNLSLGTHIGPHDGTSLFEQCLAQTIKGSGGRSIVAAAGNEYSTDRTYTGIHTGFEVTGKQATNFVIRKANKDRIYYIDLWGAKDSNLSVGLALRSGPPSGRPDEYSGLVEPKGKKAGSFLGGKIGYLINATETKNQLNGKPHVGIRITLDPSISQPSKYSFDLVVNGSGSFDAWLFPDKPSHIIDFTSVSGDGGGDWTYVAGDSKKSVAIPATSPDIIAVAAYTTRNKWNAGGGCCEVSYVLDSILEFSSSGPSTAPSTTGVKPTIAAPGGMIASALSSNSIFDPRLTVDNLHALQAGTSMAAPFVSGTIALMFSANANFTQMDAAKYISLGAYTDDMVGKAPNDRWGYGKLDVLATLTAAINGGASGSFAVNASTDPSLVASNGSASSCALTPPGTSSNGSHFLLWIVPFLTLLVIFRNRKIAHQSHL